MKPSCPPVFLTGLPRSGTTWVARVLAANKSVFGIDEPFNPRTPEPILLEYPARHLEAESPLVVSEALRRSVSRMLDLRTRFPRSVDRRKPRQLLRDLGDAVGLLQAKARGAAVLIKDPTANFLTSWLHQEFGVRPAVLVRHPCGNAAGYLRMGWSGMKYLDRPGRVAQLRSDDRKYLKSYRDQLAGDAVLSAALDWRVTNGMLLALRDSIPELVVVRYEDLACDPETRFPALTEELGLRWGHANVTLLGELRGSAVSPEALGSTQHVMKRDPREAASSWRERLSEEEIEKVFQHAGPLAEQLGYFP